MRTAVIVPLPVCWSYSSRRVHSAAVFTRSMVLKSVVQVEVVTFLNSSVSCTRVAAARREKRIPADVVIRCE